MTDDSDLMELVQLYKMRWLSCVTQEEAQRLRDEIERLRAHTPGVMPAGEGITTAAPTIDEIVVWFDGWLKEPISERERTIISETINHALRYPADVRRMAQRSPWMACTFACVAGHCSRLKSVGLPCAAFLYDSRRVNDFRLGTDRGQG